MPGLVPGIHVLRALRQSVDGRDKPGHDDVEASVPCTRDYSVPGNAPPSSRMFWPVMKPALAPHRKAQA
ncbi:MAG: hypothetical protein EKK33_24695 [Bradyrhizobiaceae bacterium]|nr:MAG: hypothetical protein EKK33_24695 [Bradyrhizobiaceae bacterium]